MGKTGASGNGQAAPHPATQLELVRNCIGDADWPAIALRLHLSPRQIQIMRLIIEEDLADQALATRMGLKLRTVETHIQRLLEKLGKHGPEARSRTAACNRVWIAYWTMQDLGCRDA